MAFPPDGPVTVLKTIPSYLFQQYADDDALQAFVDAYNELAQRYVNTFNALNLPIYTNPPISGALLDWVALGLYGVSRPNMPLSGDRIIGPYNTWDYNTLPFNMIRRVTPTGTGPASDDIFRRILTWRFFKGDGRVFNTIWLKRRIERFLRGVNGINYNVDQTYDISVVSGGGYVINVTIPNVDVAGQCQFGIESGILELPFQFTFNVTVA